MSTSMEVSISEDIAFFQETLLKWFETMEGIILGRKGLIPLRFSSLKSCYNGQKQIKFFLFISNSLASACEMVKWKDVRSLGSAGIDEIFAVFAKL